jgi:hypothetical protein
MSTAEQYKKVVYFKRYNIRIPITSKPLSKRAGYTILELHLTSAMIDRSLLNSRRFE